MTFELQYTDAKSNARAGLITTNTNPYIYAGRYNRQCERSTSD